MAFKEKAIGVIGNAQFFRKFPGTAARFNANGQHHKIRLDFDRAAQERIHAEHGKLALAIGKDLGDAAADIVRTVFLLRPAREFIVHFAGRADVHVEDIGL